MVHSSCGSSTNAIHLHNFVKPKTSGAIVVVLLFLSIPCLWAESRKEYINVDGNALAIEAGVPGCGPYLLTPQSKDFSKDAGSGSVTIHGGDGSGCTWTAASSVTWITITGGGSNSGSNSGNVTYKVSANIAPARTGFITISNQNYSVQHTVNQESGCTQSISPSSNDSLDFVGGTGTITVSSEPGCIWKVTSNNPSWLMVTSGSTGTGSGTVNYKVVANPGNQRNGTITIGNRGFKVTQGRHCNLDCDSLSGQCSAMVPIPNPMQAHCSAQCFLEHPDCAPTPVGDCIGTMIECTNACLSSSINDCIDQSYLCQATCDQNCGYTLSPSQNNNIQSGGASGFFNVSSAGCTWTVENNVPISNRWLNVTYGASGTGDGVVGYMVDANTGPARTGTLTVKNKTFTVTQADNCSYSLNTTSASVSSAGGSGTVYLNRSNSGCLTPAVTSNATWITAAVDESENGNGNVNYTVSGNTGASTRTGTITIAGKTFTITQAACTYDISPTSLSPGSGSSSGNSVTVTPSSSTCGWTAASNATSWITVASGSSSGTGNGNVTYSVTANTGPARNGSITIAGNTFPINQASGCIYTLSPTSSGAISIYGGFGSFTVNANDSACDWTVSNKPSWVTITGGSSGTGTGTVVYSVASNAPNGAPRSGSITAGGKYFTVSQDGSACQQGCAAALSTCPQGMAAGCAQQCAAQLPQQVCASNPSLCAQMLQECTSQCQASIPAMCGSLYNQCMAGCQ